jgi:hypothetical protein
MTIRAVVFDIGGVLEITPDLGVTRHWEKRLGLAVGELDERMHEAWVGGSIGTITLDDVHQALQDRLGLDERQLPAFMAACGASTSAATGPQLHLLDRPADQRGGRAGGLRQSAGRW